jgi:hypothetical protein
MKSHARSERLFSSRCVCVGKDVSLENALVLPRRRRILQRERSNNKAKKSYINNTFAHTPRTFTRSSRSDAPEKKEWSPSSFQKLQFRVFGPQRSKVTSVYRKTTSNASTSSGLERETEPFIRSITSLLYIIARVVSKQKHRLNTRKEQSI